MSLRGSPDKSLEAKASVPEGVSLDGSTDYLSRTSDLVGNIDSGTMTISFFLYLSPRDVSGAIIEANGGRFVINCSSNAISITGFNSSVTQILNSSFNLPNNDGLLNKWNHIIISFDLSNASNRYCYINDVAISGSWTTYINSTIDTTGTDWDIGAEGGAALWEGRLQTLFLDYTYRDLSIEANRRLFVNADLTVAEGQKALSPIMGFSMTDASTAHINDFGTGGDFVQNGTLATADRGANQYNCVRSAFNGTDTLTSTLTSSSTGITFSAIIENIGTFDNLNYFVSGANSILLAGYSATQVEFKVFVGTAKLDLVIDVGAKFSQNSFNVSYDTSVSNSLRVIVNGVNITNDATRVTKVTELYDSSSIVLGSTTIGSANADRVKVIGELYVDNVYTDTATDNPFWDADNNRPKPVRQVLAETGANPLVASPISADFPELNLGSTGNFTKNGTGFTGARGMSEYISRSVAPTVGTGNNLMYNSALAITNRKVFSFVGMVNSTSVTCEPFGARDGLTSSNMRIDFSFGAVDIIGTDVSGAITFNMVGVSLNAGWNTVLISFDTTDISKCKVTINRTTSTFSATTFTTNADILLSGFDRWSVMGYPSDASLNDIANDLDETMGGVYFVDQYIDFSVESTLNLFVNQLGYPRDLQPLIDDATIPTPLVYMKFDDPSNLGKNSGTGGDFTINGTVTNGADFNL